MPQIPTTAVYRARNGVEVILRKLPREYAIPRSITLTRLKDNKEIVLTHRGSGECQARIAHGPGHQSISRCERIGTHTEHIVNGVNDGPLEWTDADMEPTPTGPGYGGNAFAERVGKTIAWDR